MRNKSQIVNEENKRLRANIEGANGVKGENKMHEEGNKM